MIKKIEENDFRINKEKEKNKEDIEKVKNNEINPSAYIINNKSVEVKNIFITISPDKAIRKTNTSNYFKGLLYQQVNFSKYISEDNIEIKSSLVKNNILKRNTSSNIVKRTRCWLKLQQSI